MYSVYSGLHVSHPLDILISAKARHTTTTVTGPLIQPRFATIHGAHLSEVKIEIFIIRKRLFVPHLLGIIVLLPKISLLVSSPEKKVSYWLGGP